MHQINNCCLSAMKKRISRQSRGRNMVMYCVLISFLMFHITWAQQPQKQPWQTLNGRRPLVIARGGLSGVLPDASDLAYTMAKSVSLKDTVMFCDLQLTKDNRGFCLSELLLDNATAIAFTFPKRNSTYDVNGKKLTGWFSLDFMSDELFPNVTLIQNMLTRSEVFDNLSPFVLIEDLLSLSPGALWLNVQYDTFYNQHKLSPSMYIENFRDLKAPYISSPEIGFLKALKVDRTKTKLIFRFLQSDAVEPTTKKTYSEILKDLSAIKQFASGILVPKNYIVPVGKDKYLQPATSLVTDAHKLGLEVHAGGFANDVVSSYNYSYDPTVEYLQFVDNSHFSVDGVLTDFPVTASEAIACMAHNKNATKPQGKALIITHNGASGDYAPCTDLAYEKAVNDGADIIDCSVQMSKDGVAFCSGAADLSRSTTAVSMFMSHSTTVSDIQNKPGIFAFDLSWNDIKTLKPQLTSIMAQGLPRNPAVKNKGKFTTLAGFLEFAKKKGASGVLINIEHAAYLASKKGLDIIKAVTTALKNAALDKQSTPKVFIHSTHSAALARFKNFKSYRRVYAVRKEVRSIDKAALQEIKKVADTVDISKNSLILAHHFFTANDTHIVRQMHEANVSVHVSVLFNEFNTIPFDMYSDPIVNVATFVKGLSVDGVVTDYPATARNYLRSPCIDDRAEYRIQPVKIGGMLSMAADGMVPQAGQPPPALKASDVKEPPLPSVSKPSPPPPSPPDQKSLSCRMSLVSLTLCITSMCVFSVLCGLE